VPVPPAVAARVRAAMDAELAADRAARARHRRWAAGGSLGLLAAAAAVLLLVRVAPSTPVPAGALVERGAGGGALPDVALSAALVRDGVARRYARGEPLQPGDVLSFRVSLDRAAPVRLVRVPAGGAPAVLHSAAAPAGEGPLGDPAAPLGWAVDPGETPALFVLVAGDAPTAVLDGMLDPQAACAAVRAAGAGCDALPTAGATR
jgi:hypothetical protein